MKTVKIKLTHTQRLSLDGRTVQTYARGEVLEVSEAMAESLCLNSDPPTAEFFDEAADAKKTNKKS